MKGFFDVGILRCGEFSMWIIYSVGIFRAGNFHAGNFHAGNFHVRIYLVGTFLVNTFNPLMPSGSFNICCPRDCVSRTANEKLVTIVANGH